MKKWFRKKIEQLESFPISQLPNEALQKLWKLYSGNNFASAHSVCSAPAASSSIDCPDEECEAKEDEQEYSMTGDQFRALKKEITEAVFEEIFAQFLEVDIINRKEMKEKIAKIMTKMGYGEK